MIINRKFKNDLCIFEDISAGEVFHVEGDTRIFMKVDTRGNKNSVNLESGTLCEIAENQNCILFPKAKMSLTIHDNSDIHD